MAVKTIAFHPIYFKVAVLSLSLVGIINNIIIIKLFLQNFL